MKPYILSTFLIFASSMAFAGSTGNNQTSDEVLRYSCEPFRSSDGLIVEGAAVPEIITFRSDPSPEQILYVKTASLTPEGVPLYTALVKIDENIDNTNYKGGSFEVSIFFMGGPRAHIEIGKGIYSNCVGVRS